ncbi:MAG: phosphoglucomutase/phosphomannomutase family protein, partial [Thermomicrobiaceae bacterium]|nr:phosphoglucomutase/phosphomannomutase family protein [Thermomicrobiaceae bacterium]
MEIHFGTDGWRAIIADQFTFSAVRRVAHAFAAALQEDRPSQPPRVVVGFDRRFASDAFARAAAEALAECGVEALLCRQVVPTPVVSWTVVDERAQGGLVVTASH